MCVMCRIFAGLFAGDVLLFARGMLFAVGLLFHLLPMFVIVDICTVEHTKSAWGRVVACEVPIAEMFWTSIVKLFNRLEDYLHLSAYVGRSEKFGNLPTHLLVGERSVDFLYVVYRIVTRLDFLIDISYNMLHSTLFEQCHSRFESDELFHARHVYSVVVWIAYLW